MNRKRWSSRECVLNKVRLWLSVSTPCQCVICGGSCPQWGLNLGLQLRRLIHHTVVYNGSILVNNSMRKLLFFFNFNLSLAWHVLELSSLSPHCYRKYYSLLCLCNSTLIFINSVFGLSSCSWLQSWIQLLYYNYVVTRTFMLAFSTTRHHLDLLWHLCSKVWICLTCNVVTVAWSHHTIRARSYLLITVM